MRVQQDRNHGDDLEHDVLDAGAFGAELLDGVETTGADERALGDGADDDDDEDDESGAYRIEWGFIGNFDSRLRRPAPR